MKRWYLIVLILLFSISSIHMVTGQEMRIYNDGIIDYVPMTANFVLNAEDYESSLEEIQYSVDGSPLEIYESPISFSTEGRHIIVFRAIDKTGNISSEKIYPVIVDGTPPEGLASVDGPAFMNDGKMYISTNTAVILWAEDNLSGVDMIYVSLDNGSYIAYTEPVTINQEGYHSASTYAADNVGNKTPEYIVEGYVDSTPPVVQIKTMDDFIVVNGDNYANRENEYSVIAYDSFAGTRDIFISLDGSEYVTYSGSFKIQIPGFHSLQAKAADNLGNESNPVKLDFYVDVVPPKASMGVSVAE